MRKILLLFLTAVFLFPLLGGCSAELNSAYSGPGISAEEFAVQIDDSMAVLFNENHDNYAAYFTPEEFQEMTESYFGVYGGIGIYMIKSEDDEYPWVLGTMHESPAEAAGVKPNDRIVAIDGESISHMDLDLIASKVKGEPGTDVVLGLIRGEEGEEQPLEITVTRDSIETDSVTGSYLPEEIGIGYISIFSFTEKTPEEFKDMVMALNNEDPLKGLVIDLRNNGGGSLGASLDIASYFVKSGDVIIWQKETDGMHSDLSDDGRWNQIPLAILQNGGTASASEVLTGALQDHDIATTVGELSFGKGITQTMYSLPSGAAVRFTESRYYTPDKFDLHGKGLAPDIEIKSDEEFYPDPYNPDPAIDIQLNKAVEVVKEKIKVQAAD